MSHVTSVINTYVNGVGWVPCCLQVLDICITVASDYPGKSTHREPLYRQALRL